MKKFLVTLVLLLSLFVTPTVALEATGNVTWPYYVHLSRGPVTLAWDAVEEAEFYEIRWQWVDSQGVKHEYPTLTNVTGTSLVVDRPRGGFFVFWIRSVKVVSGVNPDDGLPWANLGEEISSEWVASTDPNHATVNGEPQGWVVYFEVPPPSSGGIE